MKMYIRWDQLRLSQVIKQFELQKALKEWEFEVEIKWQYDEVKNIVVNYSCSAFSTTICI